MQDQILTLTLNGDIRLEIFTEAIRNFQSAVHALAAEFSPQEKVDWFLETLETGSAIVGVRPSTTEPALPARLSGAWKDIGVALQQDRELPFGDSVRKPILAIASLLKEGVPSIVFQTNDEDIPIASAYNPKRDVINKPRMSIGSLKGRIDTLARRKGVRFTLYDALFDKPIMCVLPAGKEDMVRDYWGRKVIVSGKISRDGESGKPYAIRDIIRIEPAEPSPAGSWRKAIGVLKLGGDSATTLSAIEA